MIDLSYERNLTSMKFAIQKGAYHAKIVLAMAEHLNIAPHRMRKHLIETLDMITLESLAPRYDAAQTLNEPDEMKKALQYDLYTRFIPIIPVHVMDEAWMKAKRHVQDGYYEPDAIKEAKQFLAEEVFP